MKNANLAWGLCVCWMIFVCVQYLYFRPLDEQAAYERGLEDGRGQWADVFKGRLDGLSRWTMEVPDTIKVFHLGDSTFVGIFYDNIYLGPPVIDTLEGSK